MSNNQPPMPYQPPIGPGGSTQSGPPTGWTPQASAPNQSAPTPPAPTQPSPFDPRHWSRTLQIGAIVIVIVIIALIARGCSGQPTPSPATAPTTVTSTAAPDATTLTPVVLPDLTGLNLQVAQDQLQGLGLFVLDQEDASGQGRAQLNDDNWVVCRQEPQPGTTVHLTDQITLWSVKNSESCDGSNTTSAPSGTTTTPASTSRDNSSAVATELGAGTFTVGTDIAPGRYVITPGDGQAGNLLIDVDDTVNFVNEILGGDMGVPSVTTDLKTGSIVTVSNMSDVTFTPAQTTSSTTLTAGNWLVGVDIPAGHYTATPAEGDSGNFFVYTAGMPFVNEILGGDMGVPNVTVTLVDGQTIKIGGISSVTFS